jgi:hypothetical protein
VRFLKLDRATAQGPEWVESSLSRRTATGQKQTVEVEKNGGVGMVALIRFLYAC